MRKLATVTSGVLLIVGLASCAGDASDPAAQDDKKSETSSAAPSNGESSGESSGEAKPGEVTKLSGTVSDGVEANCVMLESDGEKYQLVGDETKKLKEGMKVTVTGKVSENTMSTCMEGTPFEIDTLKIA